MDGSVWAKVFGLLLGGGAAVEILRALFGRRKMRADATDVLAHAAAQTVGAQGDVIERLQQQVQALILEVDILRRENAEQRATITRLELLVARMEKALDFDHGREGDGR